MTSENLQPLKQLNDLEQAVYFHSRDRRRSLAGIVDLFRTHRIFGVTVMPVATIATGTSFPDRATPITFRSAIRITDDGTAADEHRGLIFELGSNTRNTALWIGDSTIGIRSGGPAGSGNEAVAIFDNLAELPVGLEMEIVVAVNPGGGRIRMWGNGTELARNTSTNESFAGRWAAASDGSFAADPVGAMPTDVPAVSRIAPDGFQVIEPLSVYLGSVPRHFEL